MRPIPLRIVKVGGSLLDWPQLGGALRKWLELAPPATNVLIGGGGKFAAAVRAADVQHTLGGPRAHWLAIDTMSITAQLVAHLVDVEPVTDYRVLEVQHSEPRTIVFDPAPFLRQIEPELPGTTLPASWDVTSDSIAARLAIVLAADELVLLKSQSPPGNHQETIEPSRLAELAAMLYVDRFLPRLAAELSRVRAVNLRAQ